MYVSRTRDNEPLKLMRIAGTLSAQMPDHLGVLVAMFACHAVAIAHALARYDQLGIPSRFESQFIFLVVVSLIVAVSGSLTRSTAIRGALVAVRVFCVLVAAAALEGEFVVKMLLYITLVLEATRLPSPRAATGATLGIVVLVTVAQRQFAAWGRLVDAPLPTDWIGMSLILALVSALLVRSMILKRDAGNLSVALERMSDRVENLVSANVHLQRQSLDEQLAAASEERKRVTRDIHDTVCYSFSCIVMMMNDAIMAAQRDDDARVELLHTQTIEIARESLRDTRVSLRLFRELERDGQPLATRIRKLTSSFQLATGVNVHIHFASLPGDLVPAVDEAVQRMIQEALANSVRHGKCQSMDITFGLTDSEFIVTASDDGEITGDPREGIGLHGMRERVEAAGGSLTTTKLDIGFVVCARFPVSRAILGSGGGRA